MPISHVPSTVFIIMYGKIFSVMLIKQCQIKHGIVKESSGVKSSLVKPCGIELILSKVQATRIEQ